jgi:hypothetical protein
MGRALQAVPTELRDLLVEGYHIVYEIDGQSLNVVTVMHGSMDIVGRLRRLGYHPT